MAISSFCSIEQNTKESICVELVHDAIGVRFQVVLYVHTILWINIKLRTIQRYLFYLLYQSIGVCV